MVRVKSESSTSPSAPSPSSPQGKSSGVASTAKWTPLDRRLLFDHIEKSGSGNWTAVAASVPGKTAKQCRDHWMKTLSQLLRKACEGA